MPRTDFTQEIDGALATRNEGQRHFSDIARSGNGNMRRDLKADVEDYQELVGVDERTEAATIVGKPGRGRGVAFRYPRSGEQAPMMPKAGYTWLRKLTPLSTAGQARATWVQVSKLRLLQLQRSGSIQSGGMNGLGEFPTGIALSLGVGLAGGLALWFLVLRKKKTV